MYRGILNIEWKISKSQIYSVYNIQRDNCLNSGRCMLNDSKTVNVEELCQLRFNIESLSNRIESFWIVMLYDSKTVNVEA